MLFVSCNNKTDSTEQELKPFFDLKKYFIEQENLLASKEFRLQKQITKDGKSEEKVFTNVDWQRELKPFAECDINKPSWIYSYSADTIFTKSGMEIKYISKDLSLPVKQIDLIFENTVLTRMDIHKESANSYYRSTNNYIFEPQKGFSIDGSQEVVLAEKTNYSITAKFLK